MDLDKESFSSALFNERAVGGRFLRASAASTTTLSRSSSATTRFKRPICSAFSAVTMSPKKTSSFALCNSTILGKSQLPPKSTERPRLTKISENFAESAAYTRSQPKARFAPAPAAIPLTLAMVGFRSWCSFSAISLIPLIQLKGVYVSGTISVSSAPEQNAPPAPVITRTLWSPLDEKISRALENSSHIFELNAFLISGLFRQSSATPS